MRILVIGSLAKKIIDTFTRPDSSNINPSTDGSLWKTLRGTWSISSNRVTTTAPSSGQTSNMPIIVKDSAFSDVDILQNSTLNGTSTALWVTDSNNWWAVGIDKVSENCNCTSYSCCNAYGCTGYGCTGYGCTSTGCTGYGCTSTGCTAYFNQPVYGCIRSGCTKYTYVSYYQYTYCSTYGCITSGVTGYVPKCTAYGCTGYGCTAYGCTGYGCTSYGCTEYGCTAPATCTTCSTCYPKYIRVFQSIANTMSSIISWSIGDVIVNSLRVKTSGDTISAQAYSDVNGEVVEGTEKTYTPSSPTKTKKFGIVITPSSLEQGSSSGGFTIDSN